MHSLLPLLRTPLNFIPDKTHTYMLAKCCNHLLQGQALASRLHEIDGKSLCISMLDTNCRFYFCFRSGRLQSMDGGDPNVTISGNTDDFWLLATRQEDADTLFFKRSLNIEGETETGLHIKNLIDALEFDWDAHFDSILFPPLAFIAKDLKQKALVTFLRR